MIKPKVTEQSNFKSYVGVYPVKVIAVCPDAKRIAEIYKRDQVGAEPAYVGEKEIDGKKVPNVRIDIYVQTAPELTDVNSIQKLAFFLTGAYRTNKDNTKMQVIDKYGRYMCWCTEEQYKNKTIPMTSKGNPCEIDPESWRPIYTGEEALTKFLRTHCGIYDLMYTNRTTGVREIRQNPEDSEGRIEDVKKLLKGDFSELREVFEAVPNNITYVAFGMKLNPTTGKQYITPSLAHFVNNRTPVDKINYDYWQSQIDQEFVNGNPLDFAGPLSFMHEYSVVPTNPSEMLAGTIPSATPAQQAAVMPTEPDDELPF